MMQQQILDVPLWTILDAILICKISIKPPETQQSPYLWKLFFV